MSVKKQTFSFCKVCSFYERIPDEILDETDVDSYFYHNFFDISQFQHQMVRFSKGSDKKFSAFKLLQFSDIKLQQRYILEAEVIISKRELTSLADSLCGFPNIFDYASKCIQIPLPKPEVEIGSTKSVRKLFAHYYNGIIEHPYRQIRLLFRFGTKILASFP